MSDHRRYEFHAVERPLDDAAIRALRALSTHASITRTSLVYDGRWDDFEGDPAALLEWWFDVFVCNGGEGIRLLALRLPFESLDPVTAGLYCAGAGAMLRPTRRHLVVEFQVEAHGGTEGGAPVSAESLVALREELVRGDLRALYLGWLACAQSGALPGAAVEPPRPPGLEALSAPQAALVEFLAIDRDLLAVTTRRAAARPRSVAALLATAGRLGERRRRAPRSAA
jgi:hypothetical protein